MNENTMIHCDLECDEIAKNFSWNPILESAEYLQRHPCNASIFLLDDLASISAYDRFICTHPSDRPVLDEIEKRLSDMVTAFYGKKATVAIDDYQRKYVVEFAE